MDHFNVPDNASIFNLKRVYNALIEDTGEQNFHNLIKNPKLADYHQSNVFAWHVLGGLDLTTPSSYDIHTGNVGYQMPADEHIQQELDLELNTDYCAVLSLDETTPGTDVQLQIVAGSSDLIDINNNSVSSIVVDVVDSLAVLRFKTRTTSVDAINKFNDSIYFRIKNSNNSAPSDIVIKDCVLTEGNLALLSATRAPYDELMRWNSLDDYWEISIDEAATWERIWCDNSDFESRVGDIVLLHTANLVYQDNIFAGSNITITPSVTGGGLPALTISAEGGAGGTGDWTREDVVYQSLLEHSDFSHTSFNTLIQQESILLSGCSYNPIETDTGVGNILGNTGGSFITSNLVTENDVTHYAFYVHAVLEAGEADLIIEYSYSIDDLSYSAWIPCNSKEVVYLTAGFKYIKLKFTFGADSTILTSYGILYGYEDCVGTNSLGFLERFDVSSNCAAPYTVELPNGKWYHRDSKSLVVFRNGVRLTIFDDYIETNTVYGYKSNKVTFQIPLTSSDIILFREYNTFGYGGSESGSCECPWIMVSSDYLATSFQKIIVDTTNGAVNVILPSSPTLGDEIKLSDKCSNFATSNLILRRNGQKIMGLAEDYIISVNNSLITLVYGDAGCGWRVFGAGGTGALTTGTTPGTTPGTNDYWIPIINDYNAYTFDKIMFDTTTGVKTLILPSSPILGDEIELIDRKGTFNTNNLIVDHNGSNIMGLPENLILNMQYVHVTMIYTDATSGWRVFYGSGGANGENNSWQIISSNHNAAPGDELIVDTSTGVVTVILPSSSVFGDEIQLVDKNGNFNINNLVINRNGNNICASTDNLTIAEANAQISMVYIDGTEGWRVYYGSGGSNDTINDWQLINTNYSASVFDEIVADTSSSTLTITLPALPQDGEEIQIIDKAGSFHINPLIILRNGNNMMGTTQNLSINVRNAHVTLVYTDTTMGWIAYY